MAYDPFQRGAFPVGVRSASVTRDRELPIEVWYPATGAYAGQDTVDPTRDRYELLPGFPPVTQDAVRDAAPRPGTYPLVVFSHGYGGHRRQTTFLCTHLASHGYVVAALDHTGNTVLEAMQDMLATQSGDAVRDPQDVLRTFVEARPKDASFLIDQVLAGAGGVADLVDPARIGIAGHSFGGWTTLVTTARDRRIRAALPLAPGGGASHLPVEVLEQSVDLRFGREVPTLFIAADQDSLLPLYGIRGLYERAAAPKRLVVLTDTDHLHFMDRIEENHEMFRLVPQEGLFASVIASIKPISELAPGEHAYLAVRGLGLAHMDATLKGDESAAALLAGDVAGTLARHGVRATAE